MSWTWPGTQGLGQVWNGTATSGGSLVSVTNVNWNGSVEAGDYTTFGLFGSGTAPPVVDNLTCSAS